MAKKEPAPSIWAVGRVTRHDTGGTLYNATDKSTGQEHWGVPSYDRDAIARRVAKLNEAAVKRSRWKPVNAIRALESIFEEYDGKEVDSETHGRVMEILTEAGYIIRDPNEMEETDG
jgi:hypothetical protein